MLHSVDTRFSIALNGNIIAEQRFFDGYVGIDLKLSSANERYCS